MKYKLNMSCMDHQLSLRGVHSIPLANIRGHRKQHAKTLATFVSDVNSVYAEVAAGRAACVAAGVTFSTPQMVYEMGGQWNTSSCIGTINRPSTYTEASYAESEAANSALL